MALDIGGLSLNKLADQAKQEGNHEGAKQAKRLSLALVAVMLTGVVMAGINQIVRLDGQVGTVIDTIPLIARAVMAVLYSRVIHSLRRDDIDQYAHDTEEADKLLNETVQTAVSQLEATLSHMLDERLTSLDAKQAEAFARFKMEQTAAISETNEAIKVTLETAVRKHGRETRLPIEDTSPFSNIHSITEATSRKQ